MVLIVRNLSVAFLLLVALSVTVNHAASIPTTTSSAATRTVITTAAPPTTTTETEPIATNLPPEDSSSTITSNEAQQEVTANRTENARALDLDISKYTSLDFHNKVYDLQTSPENEQFIPHEVSRVHTTFRTSFTSQNPNEYANFGDYELTTPTSSLFDAKHQEVQNEIKKKLEIEENVEQAEKPLNQNRENQDKDSGDENEDEDIVKHNTTNLDVLKYANVLADMDLRNKTSIHKNQEIEKGLKMSYESVYNQTDHNYKVHSAKSPLLNNKIENDKAINISKRGFTKTSVGDSTESSKEQDRSNLIPTLETSTNNEQSQQENNIYPVLVPVPLTTASPINNSPPNIEHSPDSSIDGTTDVTTIGATNGPEEQTTVDSLPTSTKQETKMYEMTEKDFATTSEAAFETHVSEEKFYEMTDTPTATTTGTTEFETIPTTTLLSTQDPFGFVGQEVTLIPSTEDYSGTTILETTASVTESTTITEPTTLQTEIITSPPEEEQSVTTEGFTTETTDFILQTTTLTSTTNIVNLEEEITTKRPKSTITTIIPTIAATTTELQTATTKSDRINTIVKDRNETEDFPIPTPINDMKKGNKSDPEEDFSDEVTEPDYADFQNRKMKPIELDARQSTTAKTTTPEMIKEQASPEVALNANDSTIQPVIPTTQVTTTDPDVSDATEDASRAEDEGASSGTIIAIVLSTVGAICLVLLAVLLFVMRRRQKRFSYGQRCTPVSLDAYSMDNVSVYNSVRRKAALRGSKRSYGNPAFDDDTGVSHLLQFQGIVRFANNIEGIKAEFEEIPLVSAKMNELPEGCAAKNRYANVIPLPESRVYLAQLDDDITSDYINANYVTGPAGKRGYYIACQAPLHSTVNDFWRMIWEQQSKVILMLTHLFENGVEKCVDYLPPSEVVDCHRLFGDYQVTLKKREVKDKYIISSLQLKNMESNSWREVTHLWYSGWPEKGVPEEENSIIAFLIEARSHIKLVQNAESKENGLTSSISNGHSAQSDSNPVVVHCSPGTGRTGTLIACDIAIREFELKRAVNIPRIVYRIRRDRASSVQTKDQYHFIYKVINLYATKLTGGALDSI